MRAVSSGQRLYVSPAPIVIYGVLCVPAFLDRQSICVLKGVWVLRELRRVILYTVPDAVLSFRRVFIVFLFSGSCNKRAKLSKVAEMLAFFD